MNKRIARHILMISFVVLVITTMKISTTYALSEGTAFFPDNTADIGNSANGGSGDGNLGWKGGDTGGGAVLEDVKSMNLCGITLTKGGNVRNIQKNGDFMVLNVADYGVDALSQMFGQDIAIKINQAVKSGKQTANYKSAIFKGQNILCGQALQINGYKETVKDVLYQEITLTPNYFYGYDGTEKYPHVNNYNQAVCIKTGTYRDGSSVNQWDNDDNGNGSIKGRSDSYDDENRHTFRMYTSTFNTNYAFNCAGNYNYKIVVHYSDGTTSDISGVIDKKPNSLIPEPEKLIEKLSNKSNLKIRK